MCLPIIWRILLWCFQYFFISLMQVLVFGVFWYVLLLEEFLPALEYVLMTLLILLSWLILKAQSVYSNVPLSQNNYQILLKLQLVVFCIKFIFWHHFVIQEWIQSGNDEDDEGNKSSKEYSKASELALFNLFEPI